ncbi:hypothetical protein Tco_1426997 [Tanacetum coccineum]
MRNYHSVSLWQEASNMFLLALPYQEQLGHKDEDDPVNVLPKLDRQGFTKSLPTIETANPLSTLPDFASVFRFNDRTIALEKEVAELREGPLHTQVTTLVDEHLDTWLGETREEFMKFLSESLTTRIKEQVKDQLPQILPKEVSNFVLGK